MSQYPIAVVIGSLRRDSFNRKLATAIAKLAPPEFSFKQIEIGDLPQYNQDDDANQAESVKRLKAEIKTARGLLFVTAEYNRSIPGVLKNAIDHASRPYGQSVWVGKPAGVLGASIGARPLVVSCGTQQSESLVVVGPGGHVGRLPLSLSTCPRGGCQEHGFERWN